MKKFLTILLLAIISCSIVDELRAQGIITAEDEVNLEGLPDFFKRLWEKIKAIWKSIPDKIRKAINWLKEHGMWENLIDLIKKYGTKYATDFCDNYLDHDLCADVVAWLFEFLNHFK